MIYKYYSPSDYNFDALVKSYFYFSFARKLNDPFDCSAKLFLPFKTFVKKVGLMGYEDEAEEKMKNYATCSFSIDNDNKILWSSYAANYTGYCIGFDDTKMPIPRLITWQESIPCLLPRHFYNLGPGSPFTFMVGGEVGYLDKLRNLDDDKGETAIRHLGVNDGEYTDFRFTQVGDEKLADDVFISICFTKEKSWTPEREYRLLVGNHTDALCKNFKSGDGLRIPFEKDWVKEIILGHNISINNEDVIQSLIAAISKYTNAQIYCTSPSEAWHIRLKRLDKDKMLNDLDDHRLDLKNYYIEDKLNT